MIDLSQMVPDNLIKVVEWAVVPLFLLFNIAGWFGLPQREKKRFPGPGLSDDDQQALGKAIRSAWLAGVLAALVVLWVAFSACQGRSWDPGATITGFAVVASGVLGLAAGIVRGILPSTGWFHSKEKTKQRRILTGLVLAAVLVSTVSAVLYATYFTTLPWLKHTIASAYAFMLAGYATAHVPDLIKV